MPTTPIEVLKMLKSKIDESRLNKCNYAIETSDIEAINQALIYTKDTDDGTKGQTKYDIELEFIGLSENKYNEFMDLFHNFINKDMSYSIQIYPG